MLKMLLLWVICFSLTLALFLRFPDLLKGVSRENLEIAQIVFAIGLSAALFYVTHKQKSE